jgi:hypothetical protein
MPSTLAVADTNRARVRLDWLGQSAWRAAEAVRQLMTRWSDTGLQPQPHRRGNIKRDAHTSADQGAGQRVCRRRRARLAEPLGHRLRQQKALVRVQSREGRWVNNTERSGKKPTSEHSSMYGNGGITGLSDHQDLHLSPGGRLMQSVPTSRW